VKASCTTIVCAEDVENADARDGTRREFLDRAAAAEKVED
jgi:hypothetical protein